MSGLHAVQVVNSFCVWDSGFFTIDKDFSISDAMTLEKNWKDFLVNLLLYNYLPGDGLLFKDFWNRYLYGIVQYFARIYKSEQRSDYCWPTHPPLNPNIRDQNNPYAYGLSFIHKIYS